MAATSETIGDRVTALCDDPASFFRFSFTEMQSIPRSEEEALQIEALQYRFSHLRDHIPMLKRLADKQEINVIESVTDVIPLLFEHTMYKSYPPSLLEKNRFGDINRWLSRLTTFDLGDIDVSGCRSIDEWIELMDVESPIKIVNSSGTSGTMSFLPTSKREWDKFGRMQMVSMQRLGDAPTPEAEDGIWAVFPFFRHGSNAFIRNNDNTVKFIVKQEERLLTAYPGRMSSDMLYLAARIQAAQKRGDLDQLQIPPEMLQKKGEYEALQREMPRHMERFFSESVEKLRGKRVYIVATWNQLYNMATAGLALGMEGVFAPNSAILSGGGAKGLEQPEDWEEVVARFCGAPVRQNYGMSEIHGVNQMCAHGRYHFPPWVIPFLLDPDTSEGLPRTGVVTGRAAYFDLSAETRWGGFITGDQITINWDEPCACGQTTRYIEGPVQRYSEMRGGDDKISCAATEDAHKDAMNFLNGFTN